jgi:hypothetical protein
MRRTRVQGERATGPRKPPHVLLFELRIAPYHII